MAIIRWNPLFSRSLSQWPDLWDDDLFPSQGGMNNSLDVYETENESVVRANVAGVKEDDIDITFEKGILWIKAQRTDEHKDEKKTHFSRSSWSYSYKVAVPGMLDTSSEPNVDLHNGMLTVTFKKAEASKPKKLMVNKKATTK
jgi:HSP20 family protein